MEFSISTPALLFSAISLLMLAYTNRFLALAQLIRQHIALYETGQDGRILKQIRNFEKRLKIIKYTQIFGVVSFLFCIISMFLIFLHREIAAEIAFGGSLTAMFISLFLSLQEIFLSIGALKVELERIQEGAKPIP